MSTGPRLRPSVLAAREKLAEGRSKLRAQHDRGSPGIQVCTRLTDLLDEVVLDLYQSALVDIDPELNTYLALIPHGGYGRRDVAPYSDVDLMALVRSGQEGRIIPFIQRLTQDIVDAGLTLGFSCRTVREACAAAPSDAAIFTSLAESRFLTGNADLFAAFLQRYRRLARRRAFTLIADIEKARGEERRQHGDTIYLLKPNVKRSRGGLRDLQLIRWLGCARYGENEPDNLVRAGYLEVEDRRKLREAQEFLLRLRNEMHFHAGKAQDLLDRHEQVRIASLFKYQGDAHTLPVEAFMRTYIEHSSDVRYIVAHFAATARSRRTIVSFLGDVLSYQMEGDFRVGPKVITANRRGLEKVRSDVAEVLRLMDLANRTNTRIAHRTWQGIRTAMMKRPALDLSREAVRRFLSLISQPGQLGVLLRRLHELGVLEKIIRPLAHARHLMQFNEYHRYTIDEHTIRAVECATQFLREPGPVGDAYRSLGRKWLLHLALLLHDLGKGFTEDHSIVGERLAEVTALDLGLSARDTGILKCLVRKHLLMSHLAQRRNIDDPQVVLQLAVEVGSAETLQMLFLHTCADLAAVGPGVLNDWKRDLLTLLYERTRQHLTGEESREDRASQQSRVEILNLSRQSGANDWWERQVAGLPRGYLIGTSAEDLHAQLEELRCLPRSDARAWGRFLPERQALEFTVGAYEQITPGIFHKLTGALTSKGLQILSAEIHTLADDLVLDRFCVQDSYYSGQPTPARIEEVCRALVAALKDSTDAAPTFRRTWNADRVTTMPEAGRLPTQVRVDNSTSEHYTILDIFTHDRMGLLYAISRTIFELQLSVHGARIGTHLDQVVDVFYVRDQHGKVLDEGRLAHIRQRLLEAINAMESVPGDLARS